MSASRQDLEYLKTLTVLYVEDDTDTRDQFAEFLQRLVGRLITAGDGSEGLAAFREHKPHIVVTDIQMPDMDGLAMAKEIYDTAPTVPVIVITAFETLDYLISAAYSGIERYVTKPVQSDQLLRCLLDCAQLVRTRHEAKQLTDVT